MDNNGSPETIRVDDADIIRSLQQQIGQQAANHAGDTALKDAALALLQREIKELREQVQAMATQLGLTDAKPLETSSPDPV